jgi:hypothetical protein
MNRLITTIVQLALWAPIIWAISMAIGESKEMKKK